MRDRAWFLLLNIGHFLDHLFTLIFATVAALTLHREWQMSYAELLRYATPGFVAFGLFALPAGWLADRWSRDGMMVVFFAGIGLASIGTSLANSPLQIGIGLFVIGVFASIYHPVGLAILTSQWRNTGMRIAANGVFGNLGVASAALITGYLIDHGGWRLAFALPGFAALIAGLAYLALRWHALSPSAGRSASDRLAESAPAPASRSLLFRVSAIVFLTTAVSSIIFQSTTFALPKIFEEKLSRLTLEALAAAADTGDAAGEGNATAIGMLAFMIFAIASLAQLVVGSLLDRFGPRPIFIALAAGQVVFFALMPGQTDLKALLIALGFMLGAFGQIPINDYMIGKLAHGAFRARIYGLRYVISFTVLAATLPLIAVVHERFGFDTLFWILAISAAIILIAAAGLPRGLALPGNRPVRA